MKKYIAIMPVWAIFVRHLYQWRRDLNRLVDTFWWPLLDLITWGLTSTYIQNSQSLNQDLVAILLGGIILWYFVQQSQKDINIPLLVEAWNVNLVNIFTTPLRLREFLVASILLGFLKLIATMIVLGGISYMFYQFNIFSLGIYLLPAMANLILVGWWVGFLVDGFIFRWGYNSEAFAWGLVFVIYPFSAVLYPVSSLPVWAQYVAWMLPTSYIFENMRSVLFTGEFSYAFIWAATGLNVLFIVLSIWFMNYMFREALQNGRLMKLN